MEKRSFESGLYLVTDAAGKAQKLSPSKAEQAGAQIILNPFFTSLWPQDPTNMTLSPRLTVANSVPTASWRRMQVTSPPSTFVSMNMW